MAPPLTFPPLKLPGILLLAGAVLLLTVGLSLGLREGLRAPAPVPAGGVLDLRSWDFGRDGPVALGGTWEFLPERLVSGDRFPQEAGASVPRKVPDTRFDRPGDFFQGTGGGTYRLRIRLPEGAPAPALGLRLSGVWAAFEAEADGTVLVRAGVPAEAAAAEVPALGPRFADLGPRGPELTLVIRVSNHQVRWGGIVLPPVLGPAEALADARTADAWTALLLVGALGGAAAFSLFFFGFRRKDRAYISFAVFSLLVAVRALTTGDQLLAALVPGLTFEGFVRLQHLALYLLIPAEAVFFATLFPADIGKRELAAVLVLSLLPVPAVPFVPLPVLSWTLLGYFPAAVGIVLYGYWAVCLRTSLRRRPGALPLLAAGTVLLGMVALNFRTEVFQARAENEFPLGLIAFVFVQALVLARRSHWAFQQTEKLTEDLKDANRALGAETREAEEAKEEVERALAEKEVLLKEVHHRVKNSLQIVLSIINLEARRTRDPGALGAYQGVRDRIRAISLVHDRLYGMESERQFNLVEYLEDLTSQLGEGYGKNPVVFGSGAGPFLYPMDFCLDVGLVVTELVINAYRHGLAGGDGRVRVSLEASGAGGLRLEVADDGPGFPPDFTVEGARSAGFKIVWSLVQGRRGEIRTFSGPGARVEVGLPAPAVF